MIKNDQITVEKLEKYLWDAAVLLRNKMDAGDYKIYIFPLLFYKRLSDVYDQEYQKALEDSGGDKEYANSEIIHNFKIQKGVHWEDLRSTSKNVGQKLQTNLREIEKANPKRLFGIFGDVDWTNKELLSDDTLKNLIEHFSSLNLSTNSIPDDLMGTGYEYLIKQFADDSGHTAAEFYTNRTVVRLMTKILDPKENESIYDPTCGSGGMILEAVNYVKKSGFNHKSLNLYGQEKNIMTSGIARMNVLLHGFQDAEIKRGDTLSNPIFLEGDHLKTFDVILANPPYSISKWDQSGWAHDPYGRNIYGTPPKGRADYAFVQHIICSLSNNGRAAILLPHGVLFRDGEEHIREKLIEDDKLDTVIGLPKDMFYNSVMESCIMIFHKNKEKTRKNKILFINAVKEFERKGNKNFLNEKHISKIGNTYKKFQTVKNFSYVADIEKIKMMHCNLSISKYIQSEIDDDIPNTKTAVYDWDNSSKTALTSIMKILEE